MLCPFCGREIPEASAFCSHCGQRIAGAGQPSAGEEMLRRQAEAARIRYEETRRLRAEEEERLRREAREKAMRAEEERLRRREEERLQAELRRRIREEEMERRKAAEAPLSGDGEAEIRARLRMEIDEMRRRVEEEAKLRRQAEERAREAAEQRIRYEEEQRRIYEETRKRQLIEEELRRRKAEKEEERRRAEEMERSRLAQRALLVKAAAESRQRVGELQAQMEELRKRLEAEMERLRSAEEAVAAHDKGAADAVRPETGALNDFLKRLRLRAVDVPAHEIDRKVAAQLEAMVSGRPSAPDALLDTAAVLLRSIADALVGRFGSITPMQAATMVKVAYSVADCAMLQMFLHPQDARVEKCMNAIDTIDRLQEMRERAVIAGERRDRWYVMISVLSGESDRDSVHYCASVIQAIAAHRSDALEQLQRTLSKLAAAMVGKCMLRETGDDVRRELFARAVLAELYAQMKFGADGRIGWARSIALEQELAQMLQLAGLTEAFLAQINRLIQTIAM